MDPNLDHHEYCADGFDPEDIVISGMAGRFPECDSVGELKEALYSKRNLVVFSDARFEKGTLGLPFSSSALLKEIDKLDGNFFHCAKVVADRLDPSARIHMEVVYEAIADAGIDVIDLKGQKIGVFAASSADDFKNIQEDQMNFELIMKALIPNRTSFAFGLTGPSICIDAACSSSGAALWLGVRSIRAGEVEAAVVSGCQLNLLPESTLKYFKHGFLSPTGCSRPYDSKADGFVRGESVCAVFLQKAEVARRAYASIKSSRFLFNHLAEEGIGIPVKNMQIEILKDILADAQVIPDEIQFIEGHATGTVEGDSEEVVAMEFVFNSKTRKMPLLLGSIKGNIGHTEASSGLCSVIKSLLSFETGMIAPNINYETPNPACNGLVEGRLAVATEPTPLTADCIPVTSLSLGGTISAAVLKRNPRSYDSTQSVSSLLPRLVLYPATTEHAVESVFEYIKNNPDLPEEFFALLSKLSFAPPFYKPFRGYAIYQKGNAPITEIKPISSGNRSVWFILPGFGCQWSGMGLQLMKIEEFANSMKKSAQILKSFGVDLFELLRADRNYFQTHRNVTATLVGICSIQIALLDVLQLLGITPDGIIGHSFGEVAAAYADGACTHEQTLIASYFRGQCFETTDLPEAEMAVVGVSWSKAVEMCPEDVYPTCANSYDSVTVSGLEKPLKKFVEQCNRANIFTRKIDSQGFGFHCKFVKGAVSLLKQKLNNVIPVPKPRSQRWISTSYSEFQWNSPSCKVCGPEYFSKNIVSYVRFTDALEKIPADAIVIEIGPSFLFQSAIKQVVGPEATCSGLMKKNCEDNVAFFMEALGRLYDAGMNPKVERLFPAVKFPVPKGTPMISDLIKWNHSQTLSVPKFLSSPGEFYMQFKPDENDAYLWDYKIGGRTVFPASGFVYLAWKALTKHHQKDFQQIPIIIKDFEILRPAIDTQAPLKFFVNLVDSSGHFEIIEGKTIVATGKIHEWKDPTFLESPPEHTSDGTCVSGGDIYDELKTYGHEYGPAFRKIIECNLEGTKGLIQWQESSWIAFLEAHLVFMGLNVNKELPMLPIAAEFLKIDPIAIRAFISASNSSTKEEDRRIFNFPCSFNPNTKVFRSLGIEVAHLKWEPVTILKEAENFILEEYKFIPYVSSFTPTKSSNLELSQYIVSCQEVVKKIKATPDKDDKQYKLLSERKNNNLFDEIEFSEKKVLFKILETISIDSNFFKSKRENYLKIYSSIAGKDVLNNVLMNEDSLKFMLEIVLENTHRKLNVVEINHNFPVVLVRLMEIACAYGHRKFGKSTLIVPNSVEFDQKYLKDHEIQKKSKDFLKVLEKDRSHDMVIGSFTYGPLSKLKSLLRTLTSVVKPNGFVWLFMKEENNCVENLLCSLCSDQLQVHSAAELKELLQSENLLVLSKISDLYGGSVYLLRSPNHEESQKIVKISHENFGWLEKVRGELYGSNSDLLWLVCEDNPENGILGLVNCLKQEPGGERIRCCFVSGRNENDNFPLFSLKHPFFRNLKTKNLTMNVWENETWGCYRHIRMKKTKQPRPVEHSYVSFNKPGDLSSWENIESRVKYGSRSNQNLVHVYYSAVNTRDILMATGKPLKLTSTNQHLGNSVLGFEFSGRVEGTGRRICGFAPGGALATSILADPAYCLEVPQGWTLEEAATVPVAYAIGYYALIERARLQPGESILILSECDGVGLAAIKIALSLNCKVFVTVGDDEKPVYLKTKLAQIKNGNIWILTNTSFENSILSRTNGKGVNVILKLDANHMYQNGFRCIARNGRIIDTVIDNLGIDSGKDSKKFGTEVSLHAVFFYDILDSENEGRVVARAIMAMIRDGIKSGVVQPLSRKVFDRNDVEDAFQYKIKEIHVEKVLLQMREEEAEKSALPKTLFLPATPETLFYFNKVYIVVGGLGGFGLKLTQWAIDRGARNVVLTSRHGARTPWHHFCLKRWEEEGLNIRVSTLNAADRAEAEKLLREATSIAPLGGIFNTAVHLRDAFIDIQTPEDYKAVCDPKLEATKILDELTRKLWPEIDYFVCFSSMVAGRGNAGQTNYGFANSAMERICDLRKKDGMKGLAIQWGIVGDVGLVHRLFNDDLTVGGTKAQSIKCCLQALDVVCQQECPVVASYVAAEQRQKAAQGDQLKQLLKVLGLEDFTQINMTRRLNELGIDSIVGSQIKKMIESYSSVEISILELWELKLDDIKDILEKGCSENTAVTTQTSLALTGTANISFPAKLIHSDSLLVVKEKGVGEPIFIVHLRDTDAMIYKPLAEVLDRQVYTLVWSKQLLKDGIDIESIARSFLKLIQNVTDGSFYLMGVSEGSCVAFEMARQDECLGKMMKSLILVNGSEFIKATLSVDTKKQNDIEVEILCSFVEQFTVTDIIALKEELEKESYLDHRIEKVYKYLSSSSGELLNKDEVLEAVDTHLLKDRLLSAYFPITKISSDLNLLEDAEEFFEADVSIVREIFKQFCSGKVSVQRILFSRIPSKEEVLELAPALQAII